MVAGRASPASRPGSAATISAAASNCARRHRPSNCRVCSRQPLQLTSATADLSWRRDGETWIFGTRGARLVHAQAEATGDAELQVAGGGVSPVLTATAQVDRLDITAVPKFIPVGRLRERTIAWLDRAFVRGTGSQRPAELPWAGAEVSVPPRRRRIPRERRSRRRHARLLPRVRASSRTAAGQCRVPRRLDRGTADRGSGRWPPPHGIPASAWATTRRPCSRSRRRARVICSRRSRSCRRARSGHASARSSWAAWQRTRALRREAHAAGHVGRGACRGGAAGAGA